MTDLSRRQFIAAAGAGAASVWLTANAADLLAAGKHALTAQKFEFLTPADAADLEAATSQIVPTDDTPGAREARVVYFVDKALATFMKGERDHLAAGLKELRARAAKAQKGATSFAALSERQADRRHRVAGEGQAPVLRVDSPSDAHRHARHA